MDAPLLARTKRGPDFSLCLMDTPGSSLNLRGDRLESDAVVPYGEGYPC